MVGAMRIVPCAIVLFVVSGTADAQTASQVVSTYCAGCHNGAMRSPSGALLDTFDPARMADNRGAWTRAYRQLQAGTMPPVGAPRPDRLGYQTLLTSIDAALGANAIPQAGASSREIADRLAQMLWNGTPDAPLLADATANRLSDAATLERQISRMLNDDRARAFVARFFFPWLGLDQLAKADPDKALFPDYDPSLRDAMVTETQLFVLNQLRENRDPIELWTANYTFLNGRLARHYGVAGVTGAQFRRVPAAPERAGLLGHASVLMATSRQQGRDAAFTSPAKRALWIRMRFLGAPPPQPFPGAQPVNPELPVTPQTRTLPAEPCANCHRNFFPLGYALENFDPICRWRTSDQAGPVDASGAFVDGTSTNGIVQLREVLLQRPEAFRTTVTEQLLAYAAGPSTWLARPANTRMTPDTLVRARQILQTAKPLRWSSIIAGIVRTKA